MHITNTFGTTITFLFEKRKKAYSIYDDLSIAEEKVIVNRKTIQRTWLCQAAGRVGV